MNLFLQLVFAMNSAFAANLATTPPINPNCIAGSTATTKLVTHYFIPLLNAYDAGPCDQVEGTCIYNKNGVQWIHNVGYTDVPLSQSVCKNGWGNEHNCLHPCRVLAASMKYHTYGQIVFIPDLVGKSCGNLRDGPVMIHDGYMVVLDTGSPTDFNAQGRFDFFWGRCQNQSQGVCFEGAEPISDGITDTPYCTVWDPNNPTVNVSVKNNFVNQVKAEDNARGDSGAAAGFNL